MMLKKTFIQLAACLALAQTAVMAHADTFQFTLTGGYSASWQIDSSTLPDGSAPDIGNVFQFVSGFSDTILGYADVYFWNSAYGGGLEIDDSLDDTSVLVSAEGPQLYTGTDDAPVFKTGTFALTQYLGTDTYTLTITNISAVPEPATIAMLLGGLGIVGFTARRRQAK